MTCPGNEQRRTRLLAVTACPTGIAHTHLAAEKLAQAADALGVGMKVETQGSIGAESILSDNDVRQADGIIVAADKACGPPAPRHARGSRTACAVRGPLVGRRRGRQ